VARGDVVSIIVQGTGKTTLFEVHQLSAKPTSGTIQFDQIQMELPESRQHSDPSEFGSGQQWYFMQFNVFKNMTSFRM